VHIYLSVLRPFPRIDGEVDGSLLFNIGGPSLLGR